MGSLSGTILGTRAVARVATSSAFTRQRGFKALVHNGAGDVTLQLSEAIDFANGNGLALVTVDGAALTGAVTIKYVDATHIQVLTANAAGAATDENFSISVHEIGPN